MRDQASSYDMTGGPTLEELRKAVECARRRARSRPAGPRSNAGAAARADVAEAERLAAENGGASYKTSRAVESLKIKWELFIDGHGASYGFDGEPTVELAGHFLSHAFCERQVYSTTGAQGMSDSWGERVVPYLLAKFVFPLMEYPGWVGLNALELAEKQKPYSFELRKHWQALKSSRVRSRACQMVGPCPFWGQPGLNMLRRRLCGG